MPSAAGKSGHDGSSSIGQDGLSPVVQDYLKIIWSATEWGGAPATVSLLAARVNTARATVSSNLRRLKSLGLIAHEPYGPVHLTTAGTACAVQMVRRHRLIETFLVQHLGYRWDEVHQEAESLEHGVSDLFIERIAKLLGEPNADPHGDPIPAADGAVSYPDQALALTDASPGRYRVVRVCDADPDTLRELADHDIVPGSELELNPDTAPLPKAADTVIVQRIDRPARRGRARRGEVD